MVTAGDTRRPNMTFHRAECVVHDTVRRNSDLFHDAYTSELAYLERQLQWPTEVERRR
jgi:hypothetical protein